MVTTRYQRARDYGYTVIPSKEFFYRAVKLENAIDAKFTVWEKNPAFEEPSVPKAGCHDSGPYTGFFFGGFGTASFARGAAGFFDRWQLRQGVPVACPMDTAFFELRWKTKNGIRHRRLRVSEDGFFGEQMEYHALFPLVYERYEAEDMPFIVILEGYSPLLPHHMEDSSLPVTIFNLHLIPTGEEPVEVSAAFFWPNVLGWEPPYQTSELRNGRCWPTHQNAGNYATLWREEKAEVHICQSRVSVGEPDDLCGKVMLSMQCDGWKPSYEVMFKEMRATTGAADQDQLHTIGRVLWEFEETGELSNGTESWQTHWHEPTASALCAKTVLESKENSVTFAVTMDLPVTCFGMGRRWYKYYTELKGRSCAEEIAVYALKQNRNWLSQLELFHQSVLESGTMDKKLLGAKINELYYVTSGGSVFVSRPVDGWDEETSRLGGHPHYGILEGFDSGYYYYNTLDLWVYAFAALSKNWPELAEWCFEDYLTSAELTEKRKNMIYRDGRLTDNLIYGKLPHDLGNCAEDLFVRLNGYNFRDTPNMWKDHNPSFLTAYYLHKQISGTEIGREEYEKLKIILNFTICQDREGCGIPRHNEFGDSTWDNLKMQGLSAYCGSLCIAAYAVMERLAEQFEDPQAKFYGERKTLAQKTMQKLWNGTYFVTSEYGKYANVTMSDAMLGIVLAKKAGLGSLIPEQQVKSHLLSCFSNNVKAFGEGRYGALLVAEPGIQHYAQDGGSEMQVNEVIVGSSWVLAVSLEEYGLTEESGWLAESMFRVIKDYGLQFRTPAAWNRAGQFRAPMNLRPLAVWLFS